MDRLKMRLSASSVPECVVASVILMIVFMITFGILSRLAVTTRTDSAMEILIALQAARTEYEDGRHSEGTFEHEYQGIKVNVLLEEECPGIQKLTLTTFSSPGKPMVTFRYLIEKKHEN